MNFHNCPTAIPVTRPGVGFLPGSDYPYFPLDQIADLRQRGFSQEELQDIGSRNAIRLIPSLKS
jgi:hypothetical protein